MSRHHNSALRKHAYSNILKISPSKTESFQIKILIFFSYFCSKHRLWVLVRTPQRGGSNEYPQSMFLSRNKNNVYPCKPQFYYMKVGFIGSKLYRYVFVMVKNKIKEKVHLSFPKYYQHLSCTCVNFD